MELNEESAIPFISFNERKGFVLNPEAEEFLRNLGQQRLGLISIVGKYRTGKSFFVNRVLLNRSKAFAVGPTINPCTKVYLSDLGSLALEKSIEIRKP